MKNNAPNAKETMKPRKTTLPKGNSHPGASSFAYFDIFNKKASDPSFQVMFA